MAAQLPGGGKPWFVRRRTRHGFGLTPSSVWGWVSTFAYVLAAIGFSLLLLGENQEAANWIAWGAIMSAATLAYFLTAFRMSAPIASWRKKKGRSS